MLPYTTGASSSHLYGRVLVLLKTLSKVQASLTEAVTKELHSVWKPFTGTDGSAMFFGGDVLKCS